MKKLIAMGMAGAMSAALLAGCGGAASFCRRHCFNRLYRYRGILCRHD